MHKPTEKPIEVKRVTFLNTLTPPYGPTRLTREATWQVAFTGQANLESNLSSDPHSESTTQEMIINDNPTSTIVRRQSERLSQPPEMYSPGLFFMNVDEPMTYAEASAFPDSQP